MDFAKALAELAKGNRIARAHWANFNGYVRQEGTALKWGSIHHPEQDYHAIHADILAGDWVVLGAEK